MVERNLFVYRRTWIILFSGFFEPLLYLLGIGFGVGSLVGHLTVDGRSVAYPQFVAPALMATAAMNGAIYDSTFNMYFKLKIARTYDAVLSTPMSVSDVALGEIIWALMRGSIYAVGFIAVMFALRLTSSPFALLAVPAALLIGFAFASVGHAVTTYVRSWQDFDLVMLVLMPLFLFSGTFFPLSAYPPPLQIVVQITPLYHGIDLMRQITTDRLNDYAVLDVAYLILLGSAGLEMTRRRLGALLLR
jgi:lipooligosaccharide transport system permease protein